MNILQHNNADAYICHPSIRILGTEDNYCPSACLDNACYHRAAIHMHCPFCPKSQAYHDPVILRAHYRVKHVDKGLQFAGLKILRCCDTCDIVGSIKNEKKFKGAHWHCYRCKNGFNRRDEAVKHFNTHFRNPRTTFQIQIAHEVNSAQMSQPSRSVMAALCKQDLLTCSAVSDAVYTITTAEAALDTDTAVASSLCDKDVSVVLNSGIGANETLHSTNVEETYMVIEESPDGLQTEGIHYLTNEQTNELYQLPDFTNKERDEYKLKIAELEEVNEKIEQDKCELALDYENKLEILTKKIRLQENQLYELCDFNKRNQEFLTQTPKETLPENMQKNLDDLLHEHEQFSVRFEENFEFTSNSLSKAEMLYRPVKIELTRASEPLVLKCVSTS